MKRSTASMLVLGVVLLAATAASCLDEGECLYGYRLLRLSSSSACMSHHSTNITSDNPKPLHNSLHLLLPYI
jgi:hypothetical protein